MDINSQSNKNHLKDIRVMLKLIFLFMILISLLYVYNINFNNKDTDTKTLSALDLRFKEYRAGHEDFEVYEVEDGHTEELVIAYCSEDISWIPKYVDKYKLITIYNKCGLDIEFDENLQRKNIKIITTPNIGSCDYAYLSYIIDRYDDLPDFVEFTKGSLEPLRRYHMCSDCIEKRNGKNMFFHPPERTAWENIKNFSVKDYKFSWNTSSKYQDMEWKPSGYDNMGEWVEDTPYLSPKLWKDQDCNIIFGGQFGAVKEQILMTPRIVWEELRSQQTHAREEVDHFIERTWRPLLCRKLNKSYIDNTTYF
tara:strand:- start:778 stop:1704 length:927 start_codon:yes stop_codon:yes gene_type:complete